MGSAIRFKSINVARQNGERARLKVVQGPDQGAVYVVTEGRASIGRGENNDIVISDLKASRRHTELMAGPTGWVLKDLGSANGIFHNGAWVRELPLKNGEVFTLGETVMEFVSSQEAATMMLVAPPAGLKQHQLDPVKQEQQRKRVEAITSFGKASAQKAPTATSGAGPGGGGLAGLLSGLKSGGAGGGQGLLKNPRVAILLVALAGLVMFTNNDPPPKKGAKKSDEANRDLAAYLPGADSPTSAKSAEMFFKAGFREYRLGNYLRAKTQFETVLQIVPSHAMAKIYLENCDNSIRDEVKVHLQQGKKSLSAGKLKDARGHFEAVLRLLYRDQSNPAFAEAREQLDKVNKDLGNEIGAKGEGTS